ncbi:MAG: DNA polymerase IV [Kiritimatiellae bacterium]|nr:DNA polymerase IV [Kiritimatiellia bacterium]
MKTILHVDMDAFFASVELLVHPEWRGRPLVVGSGPHERGVVSTCSYEARKYGIHSAMPSRRAYQLCPHAIFTPPNGELYAEVSRKAFEVFESFTPYVEGVSIDEAFLDITGSIHLYGSARELGEELRRKIKRVCGVTCSVGIAPNRLLAKIGSEENKPDGLTLMPFEPEEIAGFLKYKPISVLWGVGRKTVEILKPYGITVCGDIQTLPVERLAAILSSKSAANALKNFALGVSDDNVYWEPSSEKSVSNEHTFGEDEPNRDVVRSKLIELAESVGRRFRREKRWAKTAKIKLRNAAFETVSKQMPFESPARDDISFREKAIALFDALWPENEPQRYGTKAARLVGFGVTNIQDAPDAEMQPDLFESTDSDKLKKRERLSAALDKLHDRGLNISSKTTPKR